MRFRGMARGLALVVAALVVGTKETSAQEHRPLAVEAMVGWAGFVDDAPIHHRIFGGGLRIPVRRRLSVGPEVVYMIGPASDRDFFLHGSLWVDLVTERAQTRVVPYCVFGGGYMRHSNRFLSDTFASGEGSVTAGGGVRVHLTDRVSVGGEVRIGWEPHLRATGHVGVRLPRR
jgi:hypothetical protein